MCYISVDFLYDKIYLKTFENNKIVNKIIENYNPKLYIKDDNGDFKVLKTNEKIKEIKIPLKDYINTKENFLNKKIKLYNDFLPNYQYISDFYYTLNNSNINGLHNTNNFNLLNINVNTIDNKINSEIYSIQIKDIKSNINFLFIVKSVVNDLKIDNVEIYYFDNEKDLLNNFIDFIKRQDIIGLNSWGGEEFDYPCLIQRCKALNINYLKLSPFNKFKTKSIILNGEKFDIDIPIGLYFFDYKNIYKHYSKTKDNYNIDNIFNIEFNENINCYNNEKLKIILNENILEYLEKVFEKVNLLKLLDNKLNYIKIIIDEAWSMGINFDETFSTIKMWIFKLYNELKFDNLVLPYLENKYKDKYSGGYIFKPKEGKYFNIASFDTNSNYTNIIITNNISYETLVDLEDFKNNLYYQNLINLKNNIVQNGYEKYFLEASKEELKNIIKILQELNLIISPIGEYFYKKKVGILPKVMNKIFKERENIQKEIVNCDKLLKIYKKELELRENNGIH